MSFHGAAIGILRATELVLEQAEVLYKDWTEKA